MQLISVGASLKFDIESTVDGGWSFIGGQDSRMGTVLFLDTNVYLHYQDIDNIPWRKLFKDSVTIVIPPVIIRELNKHKDTPSRSRIRRRAGNVLQKLGALFDKESTFPLNEDIQLVLESRDPLIDFAENLLSREVNDDQLIASILMAQGELPDTTIVLVTSDTGLTLRAKAQRLGIQTMRLPDEYKLPEEPDPEQTKIRKLEAELRELQATQPKLSVVFENELQRIVLTLKAPEVSPLSNEEETLHSLREQYPKLELSRSQELDYLTATGTMAALMSNFVSPEDIQIYNARLEEFYEEYALFLQKDFQHRVAENSSAKIQLWLSNDGTAPAENIDVFLHFPDGFRLMQRIPDSPKPPRPPKKPLTQLDKQMQLFSTSRNESLIPPVHSIRNMSPTPEPNVSKPRIKRTNSYDVNYEVRYAKHGMKLPLSNLVVVFDSIESAHSFHVDYEILAANVPRKITGKLHVIVETTGTGID